VAINESDLAKAMAQSSLIGYAQEYAVIEGRKFSFQEHAYLIDMYGDEHPYQVVEKAAQMGASVLGMLKSIYVCDRMGKNVIYWFPTDEDVREFSKARVAPILKDSPYFKSLVGAKDVDSVGLRQIGRGFLYFRGMKSNIRMKCHDNQTEVLTRRGWLLFADTRHTDEFATLTPHSRFEWQRSSAIYSHDVDGTLLAFKQDGLDAVVTHDHRMLLRSQAGYDSFVFAKDVKGGERAVRAGAVWKGEIPDFCVQTGRREDGATYGVPVGARLVDLRDFCAFLGFYLADGCTEGVMGGLLGSRVTLTQVKPASTALMLKLRSRFGGHWRRNGPHNYSLRDAALADMLRPLGNKYTKLIPEWVKQLPPRFLQELWNWAVLGDGDRQHGHARYGTVSKRLADDYVEVLVKLGLNGSITVHTPPIESPTIRGLKIQSRVPFYNVFERTSKISVLPAPEFRPYVGKVYCATVPNGALLTRRNGQTLWSGNSIAADMLVFDELDEVTEDAKELADKRLLHSSLKWRYLLSTPTFDGYGVDLEFQQSDKRYWNLICKKCNTRNICEFQFPDIIKRVSETKAILACRRCGAELDRCYGIWVPERKTERIRGYHLCGLYGGVADLSEMLYKYESGRGREEFMRSNIGLPWISSDMRVTRDMVEACIRDHEMGPIQHIRSYMGVDQRGSELHIVIRQRDKITNRPKVIYIGKVPIHGGSFGELDYYMRVYDVDLCVIDGLPNQHPARDFAKRFPGRVYLCYYNDNQKGAYKWERPKDDAQDEFKDWKVEVNRTEALDAMYEEITRRDLILPRLADEARREFIEQTINMAKIHETDEDTGVKKAIWKRLGEDHFAHANSYSAIAMSQFAGSGTQGFTVGNSLTHRTITYGHYDRV